MVNFIVAVSAVFRDCGFLNPSFQPTGPWISWYRVLKALEFYSFWYLRTPWLPTSFGSELNKIAPKFERILKFHRICTPVIVRLFALSRILIFIPRKTGRWRCFNLPSSQWTTTSKQRYISLSYGPLTKVRLWLFTSCISVIVFHVQLGSDWITGFEITFRIFAKFYWLFFVVVF